jgi:hypothetical protein
LTADGRTSKRTLSIGICDSERTVGFEVYEGTENRFDFVLDYDQVRALSHYLQQCPLRRLTRTANVKRSRSREEGKRHDTQLALLRQLPCRGFFNCFF